MTRGDPSEASRCLRGVLRGLRYVPTLSGIFGGPELALLALRRSQVYW